MEQISEKFEELIDFNKDSQGKDTDTSKYNHNQFERKRDNVSGRQENLIGSIQSSQVNKSQI